MTSISTGSFSISTIKAMQYYVNAEKTDSNASSGDTTVPVTKADWATAAVNAYSDLQNAQQGLQNAVTAAFPQLGQMAPMLSLLGGSGSDIFTQLGSSIDSADANKVKADTSELTFDTMMAEGGADKIAADTSKGDTLSDFNTFINNSAAGTVDKTNFDKAGVTTFDSLTFDPSSSSDSTWSDVQKLSGNSSTSSDSLIKTLIQAMASGQNPMMALLPILLQNNSSGTGSDTISKILPIMLMFMGGAGGGGAQAAPQQYASAGYSSGYPSSSSTSGLASMLGGSGSSSLLSALGIK